MENDKNLIRNIILELKGIGKALNEIQKKEETPQETKVIFDIDKIKGDKGDKPERGIDYFTKEDEEAFVNKVYSMIRKPEDGKPADEKKITSILLSFCSDEIQKQYIRQTKKTDDFKQSLNKKLDKITASNKAKDVKIKELLNETRKQNKVIRVTQKASNILEQPELIARALETLIPKSGSREDKRLIARAIKDLPLGGGGGGGSDIAIGGTIIGASQYSVLFVDPANTIAQDNTNFRFVPTGLGGGRLTVQNTPSVYTDSSDPVAIYGYANNAGGTDENSQAGIEGVSEGDGFVGYSFGVKGTSNHSNFSQGGAGVGGFGWNLNEQGIYGQSTQSHGVYGITYDNENGSFGGYFTSSYYGGVTGTGPTYGVLGNSTSGTGVAGASTSGSGVIGSTSGSNGSGVYGVTTNTGANSRAISANTNGGSAIGLAISGPGTSGYNIYATGQGRSILGGHTTIGTSTHNTTSRLYVEGEQTTMSGAPASASGTISYDDVSGLTSGYTNTGSDDIADPYYHNIRVYSYKTSADGLSRVYSSSYTEASSFVYDDDGGYGSGPRYYRINWTWSAVTGATGYRVYKQDNWQGNYTDFTTNAQYWDTTSTTWADDYSTNIPTYQGTLSLTDLGVTSPYYNTAGKFKGNVILENHLSVTGNTTLTGTLNKSAWGNGYLLFNETTSGARTSSTSGNTQMYFNSGSGYLGLGTSSPSAQLHITSSSTYSTLKLGVFPFNASTNTLAVNESNTSPGNSGQTGYHWTSGSSSKNVIFTVAKTGINTVGFGQDGTDFILYNEKSSSGAFLFKKGISFGGNITSGTEIGRWDNNTGNLSVGVGAAGSARVHAIATTEQLRLGYNTSNYLSVTVGSTGGVTFDATGSGAGFTFNDGITLADAKNIVFNGTTGTKLGTGTTQKLSFWNATPIVQPTTGVAAATFTANSGTAVNDASTFDGYTIKQVVKALRNIGLLA